MTANKPLDRYLEQLRTWVQSVEEMIRESVDTAQEGREAEAANLDFEALLKNWTAMLPATHDLVDAAGVDPSVFASSFADLLMTIREKVAADKRLAEILQTSIANKIGNAQLISINFEWLEEVTPGLIADKITMIRSQGIMNDSMDELASRGEPATERLRWQAEWLVKNGFVKKEEL